MSSRSWSLDLRSFAGSVAKAWRAALAAALLPLALAGCGFEPIAASPSALGEEDLVLAQLEVESPDSRFAYRVKKEMLRSIQIDPAAPQSFSVSSNIKRAGLAIEQNDTVTRQNVTAVTTYSLAHRFSEGSGPPGAGAINGQTQVTTAVNTTASQYSTSIADREAVDRLAKETARRLVTFLRVNRG